MFLGFIESKSNNFVINKRNCKNFAWFFYWGAE